MKIISKFKDYYDHIAHRYGGGDPKLIYNRKPLNNTIFKNTIKFDFDTYAFKWNKPVEVSENLKLLIICNNGYLLINNKIYNFDDDNLNKRLVNSFIPAWDLPFGNKRQYEERLKELKNKYLNKTQELCKLVNAPVFIVNGLYGNNDIVISERVPILADLGFASIMPPEQIYQEIAFFIANVLNTPKSISIISNEQKILQAGFDLKTSFRGK